MKQKVLFVAATLPLLVSCAKIQEEADTGSDDAASTATKDAELEDFYRFLFFNELKPKGEHVAHTFVPKNTRCCKVGEKAARKGLSCTGKYYDRATISDPYQNHKLNLGQEHGLTTSVIRKLAYQAAVCFESAYAGNFKKCCQWRKSYIDERLQCRVLKRGSDRRTCRIDVRKKYAAFL